MSLTFQLSFDEDFKPFVEIANNKRKLYKFDEIREEFPELPKAARDGDQKVTLLLAQAYEHLAPSRQKLVISEDKLAEAIEDWAEPSIEKLRRWYAGESISAPPAGTMTGPAWNGDDLILYTFNFDWGGSHRYLFGVRHRLTFGEAWTTKTENLDGQEPLQLTRTSARAEELFGAKVGGFFKAKPPLCKERLFVSVDREEGAAPYVWWPEGTEATRYMSFAKLCEEHPQAAEGKFLANLADEIESYWGDRGVRHHNYKAIPDGAAYLEEYKDKNWGTYKLRYWVDQLATWKLDVPDLATVASPSVSNEILTVYFNGDKNQPCRMSIDLSKLSLSENPTIETMATERLISDTGGYHGGPKPPYDSPEISQRAGPRPVRKISISEKIPEPGPIGPATSPLEDIPPPPPPIPQKDSESLDPGTI